MKLKKKAILYMEGMLDKEEEKKFKKAIRNRPDIKEFMHEYKWVESGLKMRFSNPDLKEKKEEQEITEEQAKKDINKFLKNYQGGFSEDEIKLLEKLNEPFNKGRKRKNSNYGFLLNIAASIAFIILIISGIIHFSKQRMESQELSLLFSEYFSPATDPILQNIHSKYVKISGQQLMLKEEGKIFNGSDTNPVLRNNSINQGELLMISALLIQEQDLRMAEVYLEDILKNVESDIVSAARWYISLIYIKEGSIEKTKKHLKILCQDNSNYKTNACNLLKTLQEKIID